MHIEKALPDDLGGAFFIQVFYPNLFSIRVIDTVKAM